MSRACGSNRGSLLEVENMDQTKDKMTIIFMSGTFDKAIAAMILATTAAAMNMKVAVFFTFWGLNFLKKGKRYRRKHPLRKMLEFMTPGCMRSLPLTHLNMLGIGPVMMKALMKKSGMASLPELFETAVRLGVKFYACSTSCSFMGLEKEDLIPETADIVGAAYFLNEARNAKINLFI